MATRPTRRQVLLSGAALGAGLVLPRTGLAFSGTALSGRARSRDSRLRVLSIGVVGTIGGADRHNVSSHPNADIVGLCDVDDNAMAEAASEHPDAFRCKDYREAFERHADKFDAVIVATPDHAHCAIMTLAFAHNKHIYGQKPLVQQLEELETLNRAVKAKPSVVTQVGAQRIESPARRAAVDILKQGMLGKVIDVHVLYGGSSIRGGHYRADGILRDPIDPPQGFDYDLWLNGSQHVPCRPQLVQRQWRSWWNFGGGQITDWVVHLTDVLYYAFPELTHPTSVCTRTPSRDLSFFHADKVLSTLTYPVESDAFANSTCNVYFYDSLIKPDRAHLGIGEGEWPDDNATVVVCEGGTLVLAPSGPIEVWREGQKTDGLAMPGLPKYESFNHWHAWVDKALGLETPHRWMPFEIGLLGTEAGMLAVKAAKYPGQVLQWDRSKVRFTNHNGANRTLLRREYRSGFEPVVL